MMAAWKLGPALAAGNTVVFKPSPETPLTASSWANWLWRRVFPAGVLNIIADGPDIAPSLVSHPVSIWFRSLEVPQRKICHACCLR